MKRALFSFALMGPIVAAANCFDEAGAMYGLNPDLLRSVVAVESNNNPSAMNKGHVRETGTVDIGLAQINSGWLSHSALRAKGITQQDLIDNPCLNLKVGAWILADTLNRVGNTWNGVGAYNASCTTLKGKDCDEARLRYAKKVHAAWVRLSKQPAKSLSTQAKTNKPTAVEKIAHLEISSE